MLRLGDRRISILIVYITSDLLPTAYKPLAKLKVRYSILDEQIRSHVQSNGHVKSDTFRENATFFARKESL